MQGSQQLLLGDATFDGGALKLSIPPFLSLPNLLTQSKISVERRGRPTSWLNWEASITFGSLPLRHENELLKAHLISFNQSFYFLKLKR